MEERFEAVRDVSLRLSSALHQLEQRDNVDHAASPLEDLNQATASIRSQMQELSNEVERLTLIVDREGHYEEELRNAQQQYAHLRTQFRKTILALQAKSEKKATLTREELLRRPHPPTSPPKVSHATEVDVQKQALNVRQQLDDLNDRVLESLARSHAALEQSVVFSDTLQKVSDGYHGPFAMLLRTSSRALTKLKQRDFTDRFLISLTFFTFLMVAAWIVWRRVGGYAIVRAVLWVWESIFATDDVLKPSHPILPASSTTTSTLLTTSAPSLSSLTMTVATTLSSALSLSSSSVFPSSPIVTSSALLTPSETLSVMPTSTFTTVPTSTLPTKSTKKKKSKVGTTLPVPTPKDENAEDVHDEL